MKRISVLVMFLILATPAFAAGERTYGNFEVLGKSWFLVALNNTAESGKQGTVTEGTRLELKVVEDEISPRRFRQLWMEALASAGTTHKMADYQQDLDRFFSSVKGALLKDDRISLELQSGDTVLVINHYDHAHLSAEFMSLLVDSLTARIAPIPQLRQGLLGLIEPEQMIALENEFHAEEIPLQRISQTSRWLRFPSKTRVSQL
ncbi:MULTISPECIES: hypothetical protein [unclassified Oceanobacter]|uniref:hypothetical protein n=2 Tax=Gammaproteobacteria TaxID=1236 RepID=UPI0027364E4C|nr:MULTISPECIES: hypothetical protein [unclassified Oceanobacter]MDP2504902.1 hypothetical protein [Oceanobacter sp. 3_MG-2023]MDP2546346.1 hypothetical protein [Oceanobacter sp. 4_MG-2023]MDP2610567.1 hypothetical protein [Oceanobacter sp. 1_MG-2023]MDP2613824.1 hypothetical protein [Oceanobacter sp. 2_MG-2023]